ncbi:MULTISPECIES: heparinase II/III-family protein [unclassified Cupriavidus]|uniref:heparinase II/III family protein n=1 Tax=unclassified Cupriavidus TaxID=2640874 RepID=UPI0010F76A2D|nr:MULTISPECIES: heparinase II/III-family protein [unclassified Cupriavidus]MWL88205.1 heparinase [Cupriavidus sp. SW-Y-13]
MNRQWIKARTAIALGLPNIGRAVGYRVGVRLGVNKVRRLHAAVPAAPFFAASSLPPLDAPVVSNWVHEAKWFGRWSVAVSDTPPDWFANPITGARVARPELPWWQIPDFDPQVGDIKAIWEASRMDWVLAFAQRVRQGDAAALARLNSWLADWSKRNAPYIGPNWKCGQEASIRVMHLIAAAMMLGQVTAMLPGLRALIELHLQRIAPTVSYAMAQDNNHGTSEAAALFIGGTLLAQYGVARAQGWATVGRRMLENRAARLIGEQGTFSQYSANYHRLMLDTFSWAETWRRLVKAPAFSDTWYARARAATAWLHAMTDPKTGDVPNVGANDGARLLPLSDSPYRDFRPSVQLAMAVFGGKAVYADCERAIAMSKWLGVPARTENAAEPGNLQADDGGFAVLRQGPAMALLRYPRFRFRPCQADALHVDLWLDGASHLRDAGTFSYNTEPRWLDYFGGVRGHNTVQFDEREQMPRLSRFLFGDWLKTETLEPLHGDTSKVTMAASYVDRLGARHNRHLCLDEAQLEVRDQVTGFAKRAVLRWRLRPGQWRLEPSATDAGFVARGDRGECLALTADVPVVRCELVEGWESLHYLEKTPAPVLELEIDRGGTLVSRYYWTT